MKDLLATVRNALDEQRMLAEGEAAVVAASGGCDSMVLLDLLARLARRGGWRLTVAHFNHRLRGRASNADERFVRTAAGQHNLPCVTEAGEVRSHARESGFSLEMAARELRHAFLARTARAVGATKVLLAHHADDQVETFLLRLVRGAGAQALAGMKWVAPSPANPEVLLLRPLLGTTRAELRAYARKRRIAFREDASNAALDLQRNRIRRRLLPWLAREVNSAIVSTIRRIMTVVGDDADVVDALARGWLAKPGRQRFEHLPAAVQRQIMVLELRRLGIEPTFDWIEWLRLHPGKPLSVTGTPGLAGSPRGHDPAGLALPRPRSRESTRSCRTGAGRGEGRFVGRALGQVLRQANGVLSFLHRDEVAAGSPDPGAWAITGGSGAASFAGIQVAWRVRPGRLRGLGRVRPEPGIERFDADQVGKTITLRHWQPGDRFQPLGLPRAAKLQDLFTNAKVPPAERHCRVLGLTASGEIFWVEGLRIGERFKLRVSTRRTLEWRWCRPGTRVAVEKPPC